MKGSPLDIIVCPKRRTKKRKHGSYNTWAFAFAKQNNLSVKGTGWQRDGFNVQQQYGQHTGSG